jgi:hypothetical protein
VDWKTANADVGRFPRGHVDLLKWEQAQAQKAPARARSAAASGPHARAGRRARRGARPPALRARRMRLLIACAALALAGCASVTAPDALRRDVEQLAATRSRRALMEAGETLEQLLARQPLEADTAVRIAC